MAVPNFQLLAKLIQTYQDTAFASHILLLRFEPSRVNVFCWASSADDLEAVTFEAVTARKIAVLGYRIAAVDTHWEVKGVLESREPYRIRRSDDSDSGKRFMVRREFDLRLLAPDPCSRRVIFDFAREKADETQRVEAELSFKLKEERARIPGVASGTLHLV